ncbi:ATP-binding protein [Rhodobacter capsulatus]|uniref:hybrid sensor histidine kinase/response regulator n=1 Tax=Rhodobacter capsulatus TaxID=1061 RepID=UPI0004282540|nr:PAS domain-containing hybrid sensor histidine kinase/response regulator [Rhodobacter capsulatus]
MSDRFPSFLDPRRRLRPFLFAGLVVVFLGAVGALYRYGVMVQSEIDNLAIANSDSLQWTLAQLEVEYFHMDGALLRARPEAPETMADFSRSFDVFYSRVHTIMEGRGFAAIVTPEVAGPEIARIDAFLHETATLVDAGPEALAPVLPELRSRAGALEDDVRTISLEGVREFAARSMAQRERVFTSLMLLASLTTALLAAITAGLVITWSLWRFGMRQTGSLSAAKARLEAVIGTSFDAVIVVDHEGKVLEFNGAAERVFGYSHAEAVGQHLNDLIVPEAMKSAKVAGFKRYRTGGVPRIAGHGLIGLQARRKDGSVFPAEISVTATRIGRKEIFVGYMRDITDRVAAEKELIDARDAAMAGEQAQAEFVAVMSHEMRTPLNGLLGTLELLRETPLDASQAALLGSMQKAGEILLSHVNNTLDVERLDAGKLSLSREPFAPMSVLDEIVQMQAAGAGARGNRLETRAVGRLPDAVEGDAMRIRQVLLNLVGNAIKFTRDGTITLEAEYHRDQGQLEYRVIDTGIGIPPGETERIFDDFVTLDPELSREATGSGLGLSIARRLMRAMRGQIGVESDPGQGSAFWITLPAPVVLSMPAPVAPVPVVKPPAPPALAAAAGSAPCSADGSPALRLSMPIEVLVVEDNDINRVVLCEMLRRAGHSIAEARDGVEAVEKAAERRYDVILIDLNMPRMNGVDATEAIRAGTGPNHETPIIAVTANVLPEARNRLEAAGVCRVISKPITRKMLDQVLAEELCPRLRQQNLSIPPEPEEEAERPLVQAEIRAELAQSLGPEMMAQTLQRFLTEGAAMIAALTRAAAQERPAETAALAHKFAGSAALLGAERLHHRLKTIELALRPATPGTAPDAATGAALDALAALWAETRAQLETAAASGG